MSNETNNTAERRSQQMQQVLDDVVEKSRADIEQQSDPQLKALLETTAEVSIALKKSFQHYSEKSEPAWQSH